MIDKEMFNHYNYVMKDEYLGSDQGMRYRLKKVKNGEEDAIEVCIWPEPYGYHATPEEKKQRKLFEKRADIMPEIADWLNEQLVTQQALWNLSR